MRAQKEAFLDLFEGLPMTLYVSRDWEGFLNFINKDWERFIQSHRKPLQKIKEGLILCPH